MYSIKDHMVKLEAKEEHWAIENLEGIIELIGTDGDLPITKKSLKDLDELIDLAERRRDNRDLFCVDFQTEWSRLGILKSVRYMVNNSLKGEG